MDRYYIDYRTGEIVKNLDTTYMAPELYNEIITDDALDGIFKYTYSDSKDRRLDFSFTRESVGDHFHEALDVHCKRHNFEIDDLVDKRMYISKSKFDEFYKR